MKTMIILTAITIFTIQLCTEETAQSPNNNNLIQDKYFTAIVLADSDINCKLPLIDFTGDTSGIHSVFETEDSSGVDFSEILNKTGFGPFVVIDFPDSLKITGLNIKIKFRKAYKDEVPVCPTLGPNYISIVALSVVKSD